MDRQLSGLVLIKPASKKVVLVEVDQHVSFEMSRLLKEAQPSREKIHQLTKLMIGEIEQVDFETMRRRVIAYYQVPFEHRTAGQFMRTFGILPYPWLHSQFLLNFSNAHVSETRLVKVAGRLRFLLQRSLRPPKPLADTRFLHMVIARMVQRKGVRRSGLRLSDFVREWRKCSHLKWGDKYEEYFVWFDGEMDIPIGVPLAKPPIGSGSKADIQANEFRATQTELDWMKEILKEMNRGRKALPEYPLSRGPLSARMRQLEKVVRLIARVRDPKIMEVLCYTARNICTSCLEVYGQDSAA